MMGSKGAGGSKPSAIPGPGMSLAELTVDLLFKVFDGLDAESARRMGATSAWHRAVLTGWQHWRPKGDHSPSVSCVGRPRLLRQKEKNESVVRIHMPRSARFRVPKDHQADDFRMSS